MCAGTAVFPAGQRTEEFQPSLGRPRKVMVHFSVCFRTGTPSFPIVKLFLFEVSFHIQGNKGLDVVFTAVNVIRHCIMGRIQEPLADMNIRNERSHSELGFQKFKGVMF